MPAAKSVVFAARTFAWLRPGGDFSDLGFDAGGKKRGFCRLGHRVATPGRIWTAASLPAAGQRDRSAAGACRPSLQNLIFPPPAPGPGPMAPPPTSGTTMRE